MQNYSIAESSYWNFLQYYHTTISSHLLLYSKGRKGSLLFQRQIFLQVSRNNEDAKCLFGTFATFLSRKITHL